jgi:hypothetical protein
MAEYLQSEWATEAGFAPCSITGDRLTPIPMR